MVCCGLPPTRGVGHHAPTIRLGDLDSSIALSLESHPHLRISIIDSIVGEFPAVLLVSSLVIRLSAMSQVCTISLFGQHFPIPTWRLLCYRQRFSAHGIDLSYRLPLQ
jgi:hypothetical protein